MNTESAAKGTVSFFVFVFVVVLLLLLFFHINLSLSVRVGACCPLTFSSRSMCPTHPVSLLSCSPSWWSGLLGVVPSLDGLHPASSMDPILLRRIPARTWSEQCIPSADTSPGNSSVGSVRGSQVLIPLSYRCLRCGWTISSQLSYAHKGMGYVGLASGLLHQGRRERRTRPL